MFRRIVMSVAARLGRRTAAAAPVVDLDTAAALLSKLSGRPLRPYSTRDFGRDQYAGARSVLVEPSRAMTLVYELREKLGQELKVFIGTVHSLARPPVEGVEVVVGRGQSQFDILRIAASDAVNYNMGTDDLIAKLAQWDLAYGIDIYQAGTDTIQLRLKTPPSDVKAFASEVYAFCPDIVDQGIGSIEKLEQAIRESREVFLWWD